MPSILDTGRPQMRKNKTIVIGADGMALNSLGESSPPASPTSQDDGDPMSPTKSTKRRIHNSQELAMRLKLGHVEAMVLRAMTRGKAALSGIMQAVMDKS